MHVEMQIKKKIDTTSISIVIQIIPKSSMHIEMQNKKKIDATSIAVATRSKK
jgi:hypothetical protein